MNVRKPFILLLSVLSTIFLADLIVGRFLFHYEPQSILHVAQAGPGCSECKVNYDLLPRKTSFSRYSDCFHAVSIMGSSRKKVYTFPAFGDGIERFKVMVQLRKAKARSASFADYSDYLIEKPFKGLSFEQAMDMLGLPSVIGGKTSLVKDADTTVPFDAYNLSLFFKDGVCVGAIQWKPNTEGKNLWEPKPAKRFDLTAVFEPPAGSKYTTRKPVPKFDDLVNCQRKAMRLENLPTMSKPYQIMD